MRTFTEKLLAYALGRGLEPADMPAVRAHRARRGGRTAIAGRRSWTASSERSVGTFRLGVIVQKGRLMIALRKSIPRRTVLRGLGASLALPLLDGMVPALTALAQTAAAPVHRFGVVYVPNGMVMENYLPATEGAAFELTPTLQALAPFRVADDWC